MSLFDSMRSTLDGHLKRFNNKDFMEALMAGCALVASADGQVEEQEKKKMSGFIQRMEQLQVFDRSLLINLFNKYVDELEFDFDFGKGNLMKELREVKGDEQKQLIMTVLVAIAKSDGEIEQDEVKVLREIISVFGLNPSDYPV